MFLKKLFSKQKKIAPKTQKKSFVLKSTHTGVKAATTKISLFFSCETSSLCFGLSKKRGILLSAFFLGSLLVSAFCAGFRINPSQSLPRGIWKASQEPLTRGQVVLFCPPQWSFADRFLSTQEGHNTHHKNAYFEDTINEAVKLAHHKARDADIIGNTNQETASCNAKNTQSLKSGLFDEARTRGYVPAGFCAGGFRPLMKKIVALFPDTISFRKEGVFVNGQKIEHTQPLESDTANRPLPQVFFENKMLNHDELLTLAPENAYSFDSRYFGPIGKDCILSVLRPIWVFIEKNQSQKI